MVVPIQRSDGSSTFLGGGDESYSFALRKCYNIGWTPARIPIRDWVQPGVQNPFLEGAGLKDDVEERVQKQKNKFGTAKNLQY